MDMKQTKQRIQSEQGSIGNARPIKFDLPFDEAVTHLLSVKPPAKQPKKKAARATAKTRTGAGQRDVFSSVEDQVAGETIIAAPRKKKLAGEATKSNQFQPDPPAYGCCRFI